MNKGLTWTKLPPQQKLEYGFWVVTATLSAVIVALFSINVRNDQQTQIKIEKAVAAERLRSSNEILYWKHKADAREERYISYLEAKEKKLTEIVEKLEN